MFGEGLGRAIGENAEQLHVRIHKSGLEAEVKAQSLIAPLLDPLLQVFAQVQDWAVMKNCISGCMQAFLKPLAKSLRYMALPNWHDGLDDAIGEFALRKREGFADHLCKVRL